MPAVLAAPAVALRTSGGSEPEQRPRRSPAHVMLLMAVVADCSGQILITCTQWHKSQSKAALLAFTAGKCAALAFALGWPDNFWAHRLAIVPLIRIVLHMLPHVRQTGVGAALVLERAAQPGVAGLFVDLSRVMAGTRQLGVVAGGLIFSLPPLIMLLQQSALLWLSSNSSDYCSSQLLADPLTQQRAASLATALEFVATPTLVLQPTVPPGKFELVARLQAGQVDAARVCAATLTFLHLALCIVLPLLLSLYTWRPQGGPAAGAVACPAGAPAAPWWRRAAAEAARCWRSVFGGAHGCLSQLLCILPRFDARAAVVTWWVLSLCWSACKHMAGLQ